MAQSLVKLTLESNQYEKNLRQAKRSWEEFTRGIGISTSKITGVTAAIGATTAALKVAKDAFFANEQMLDEWGRTVEASRSLYDGFLKSINNGDITGFLSRMGDIVNAAREAYDAMDELGTFNAFNQINTQRTRTNYMEAYAGYRTGEVSKQQVQNAAKAYQDELRSRQSREQRAYEAAVYNAAAKMGVPRGNLEQILSEYTYEQFDKLKNTPMTGKQWAAVPGIFPERYEKTVPANDTERIAEALRQLNDTELEALQQLGAQAQRTGEEIANVDKQLARVLRGEEGSKRASGRLSSGISAAVKTPWVNPLSPSDIQMQGLAPNGLFGNPMEAEGYVYLKMKDLTGSLTEAFKDLKTPEPDDKKETRTVDKISNDFSQVTGGITSIASGLEQMGFDIPEELTKIISIMSGISSILVGIAALSFLPFNRGGVVHAASGYTVPGKFGYDAVPALLTSGEVVLNRAQQGNLASQLQGNGLGNLQLTASIQAEQIRLALNNSGRRTGRGEYVQTNFR